MSQQEHSCLVKLHPTDNTAITRQICPADTEVVIDNCSLTPSVDIPQGHKLAIKPIPAGEPVVKFGQAIGFAAEDIQPGEWVHVHNVVATKPGLSYEFATQIDHPEPAETARYFKGFRRRDGRAGTRNYIALISTVNCSATTARYVAQELSRTDLSDFPNIDGIVPLVHKGGCALAFDGEDHRQLNRTLAGFAQHPNVVASLVLGLGCETAQATHLQKEHQLVQLGATCGSSGESDLPATINIQETGGVRKTVDCAVGVLRELLPIANDVRRVDIPLSELMVALECGGSDGNSGVTANPAVGYAADRIVAHGGTVVLSETTEIYGAEHLLTRRAINREVGEALLERLRWWEDYAKRFDASIDNNPSVGNKNGGLTNIFEKSLGAIAKAGTSPLRAVYGYAEPITERGFVIMDSPGFDPASITGKVASGSQVVVFTTGRGSCFGCKPSPSIKVATNTPMFERMRDDMDINAGVILDGISVEEVGEQIFESIIATASGQQTLSEAQGIGDEEFCPWVPGPIF